MATIPVEKKSGTPWWMWLLPLLLLVALLFFFLGDNEDDADQVVVVDEAAETAPGTTAPAAGVTTDTVGLSEADTASVAAAGNSVDEAAGAAASTAGGAITSAADLYAADLTSLVGRRVEIEDATVLSVTGDSTFYVGSGGQRFLVALSGLGEAAEGPGAQGADGRFNIDAGDRIAVRGTVTRFDAANRAFRRLSEADRAEAATRGAFVNVTRAADVTSR